MSDLIILKKMIREEARVSVVKGPYGRHQVTLIEPQCPTSIIKIYGMPENSLVIKSDAFPAPDAVFVGAHGECKRADYVIVAESGNKKRIVCIEMKAGKKSRKELVQQLSGAQCFMRYCEAIGKTFWHETDFLKGFAYRFVSIERTSMSKRRTAVESTSECISESHDRPDRMLQISAPYRLDYNKLAGAA